MVGAVIYVGVSTKEQTENPSLSTQLRACEECCRRQGYDILERFHEEGESAKTTDCSQLQNLLKYCRTRKGKVHFVVVYNLTRFAREKDDHFALRAHEDYAGRCDRVYVETVVTNEAKEAGQFSMAELTEVGAKYVGAIHSAQLCAWNVWTRGQNVCRLENPIVYNPADCLLDT